MRKSVTKIVKATVAFAMAIGAGVGAAFSGKKANPVLAAAGDTFELASSISANDLVTFVGINSGNYYSSAGQANNNRSGVSVAYDDGIITAVATTSIFKVEADPNSSGYWNFYDVSSEKYLYNASTSSKSYLRSNTYSNTDTYKWTVSIAAGGVATIASKSETRPNIKFNYNSGSPLFNCYASGQSAVYIYKKQISTKTLTDLVISSGAGSVKKAYDDGDSFDPTGLVINAEWDNELDTEHNVLDAVTWSPSPLTAGTTSVTGTYTADSGSDTVTISGLTVTAPDIVIDANSNTPAGIEDDTSITTGGEGKINSSGVTYQYLALAVNEYNSVRNLEFNRVVSGAYIGNKESYGNYIRRIKLTLTSNNFDKFTMFKGDSPIPGETEVAYSGTGHARFYNFNDDSEYFALKQTTTGTWVNISKIEVFFGSVVPVVNGVSASIKNGTYYEGSTLSVSDFNVTASWTGGKADTHPISGFTWTVNGIANGSLNEGDNSVVVTYEGIQSSAFNVAGSPAAAKDVIEGTLNTQSNLTYHYSATEITKTDVLDNASIGVSGSSYSSWDDLSDESNAVYAGCSSGGSLQDPKVQLKTKDSESGIVTTTSGGEAKSISLVWNSSSTSGKTLDVYGKNEAYSAATDLYDNGSKGTKLGSIVCGTNTSLAITGNYSYIGLRSNDGAVYLDSISIEWSTGNYSYSFSNAAIKFGGCVSSALWNRLNTESHGILGYGVMVATKDYLSGLTIKNYYDLARDGKADVDSVFTEVDGKSYTLVDGLSIKCFYNEVSTMPRLINGNYVWDLVKGVNGTNAGLTKDLTAVAFIRTNDDEIIFLQETTKSAAQVAKDMINADPDDEFDNAYAEGSLGYLAGLAA